tara:strand:+ start:859 stop:1266 length:408 start_codon:yes stop_codon:yes gene_type:complete
MIVYNKILQKCVFLLALIVLIGYNVPTAAQEEKITKFGVIVSTCLSLKAIKGLAEMDKSSDEDARNLFMYLMSQGKCGRLPQPTLVPLEKFIGEYEDSEGEIVQIWKLYKLEHWSLVRKKFISDEKGNETNAITI